MANKDVNYYLNLPYSVQIQHMNDESGQYYYAKVMELDGCHADGRTVEEAYKNLRVVMSDWIDIKLEHGDPIPEPVPEEEYSGKFVVRVPKSLHRQLAQMAAKEGISLNQYVLHKLSK
ncbi:type II toxin-antitoxin system HicB family antitoxin [Aneurinibacillus aneurinilyticus]|uniref:type II toxin-antitoxin system HicB family antitoxin n=1 Tax=Aneurinibacillus aneurinilyticus TaxID=1391 RepID=UPI002E1DD1C0